MSVNVPENNSQQQPHKGIVDSLRVTIKASDLAHDLTNQASDCNGSSNRSVDDPQTAAGDDEEAYYLSDGTLVPVSLVRSFYELSALGVDGRMVQFSRFEGRVVLVINVATGDEHATREFTQMNEFAGTYDSRGLSILAFPCNQLGYREPWEDHEIPLCLRHVRPGRGFAPKFHLMARCDVNGTRCHPVFEYLKQRLAGCSDDRSPTIRSLRGRLLPPKSPDVRWNFEKFLIGHDGRPFKRFSSRTPLKALAGEVENLLRKASIEQSANRQSGNKFVHYDPGQDRTRKKRNSPRGKEVS
ncbi:glutathione peroxidase 2-like [Acanthaster planci]|uniref:Glutathione peroxidase n=1 Tax=Acanthaster planci TaxID=133434 RepID=A0A8B7ZLY6_ACAPL|nr:glutathione peroxidase 2-like [Acanthaster planci]